MLVKNFGPNTATYRAQNPASWNWSLDTDFLSAILYSIQAGNWQRGGGKGDKPKAITRPDQRAQKLDVERHSIVERKSALDDELERRRKMRDRKGKRKSIKRDPLKGEAV